ncbi:hypothetical protein BJ958_001540 [Nocardioides kongjuensis]|uniref:Uncharacterized protein n=1 Tax=Nocardioides kongjuensis TaxID=349522 RepID=A0A852RPU8_9ACTN|nr:hypothetical protein [Nocardioides kongjuensis]NYD29994.1 hypothetical protein [Nocardioides kongjuensis]
MTRRTGARWREAEVKAVFVAYALVITVGLVLLLLAGARHA